jgi:hypothetical protein
LLLASADESAEGVDCAAAASRAACSCALNLLNSLRVSSSTWTDSSSSSAQKQFEMPARWRTPQQSTATQWQLLRHSNSSNITCPATLAAAALVSITSHTPTCPPSSMQPTTCKLTLVTPVPRLSETAKSRIVTCSLACRRQVTLLAYCAYYMLSIFTCRFAATFRCSLL